MNKKTIKDVDVTGKRVILRVDLNVPLDENYLITNDKRIKASLPTMNYLLDRNAKLIVMSHLGRPKGKVVPGMSLAPVAARLADLLGRPVIMADDCVGEKVKKQALALKEGEVLLLENLRFHQEETDGDEGFARQLADLAEIFVFDAFGTAHRKHASTAVIAQYLPAVAGLLMGAEIEYLGKIFADPQRPLMAIIGGSKISDKIGVALNFLNIVDTLVIGGGMANTFLKAQGYNLGNSLVEDDKLEEAKEIMRLAKEKGIELLLPVDLVVAESMEENAACRTTADNEVPDGWMALDIGPETCELYSRAIMKSKTIVWNGPMGVFEMQAYAKGTMKIAAALAQSGAFTIVGGGDSVSAVTKGGFADKMTHISTGGGSTLKFLEGKSLPALDALNDI